MNTDVRAELVRRVDSFAAAPQTTNHERALLGRELIAYFRPGYTDSYFYMRGISSQSYLQVEFIAQHIVMQAKKIGAEAAFAAFERLFTENRATGEQVVAIWGLHPTSGFEVWNDIYLKPLADVPSSDWRDGLLGLKDDPTAEYPGFHVRARPDAALTSRFEFNPVVEDGPDQAPVAMLRSEVMLDITRCLTLLTDRAVTHVAEWSYVDAEYPVVGGTGGGGGQAIIWEHRFEIEPAQIDEDHARRIAAAFFGLKSAQQTRLRVVFDRLNLAKLHMAKLEDRAIDLGIALEALLLDPARKESEISLNFRLRGAVLSGADPVRRLAVAKQLDDLYTLRSRAAHGVAFDDQAMEQQKLRDKIASGIELAHELIERVLALGYIPEQWIGHILGTHPLSE